VLETSGSNWRRWGYRALLPYFGVSKGRRRFFVWLDDRPMLSDEEWETWEVRIPADMIELSPDFDCCGELILASRRDIER
jgi:hypothetical protein